MLGADDSLNQDDVAGDLKMELIILTATLKDLIPKYNFAPVVDPLLSDQGPAKTVVPKLKKQIQRMTKVKDDFLQTRAANIQGRMSLVPEPAGPLPAGPFLPNATSPAVSLPPVRLKRGPSAAQSTPNIFVAEVLPAWGPLKRFENAMDQRKYNACVQCVRIVFDHMKSAHSGGPRDCKQRCSDLYDIKIDKSKVITFFCNRYLQFEMERGGSQGWS